MTSKTNAARSIALLIVEDCMITLKSYTTVFSMLCPEVTIYAASNGLAGLELFKEHLPDIVLTDLNMPQMDGRQMVSKIRAIKPDTKIVILTGDKERLELAGASKNELSFDYVIEKPVDFQNFFAAIKQCINEIAQHGTSAVA